MSKFTGFFDGVGTYIGIVAGALLVLMAAFWIFSHGQGAPNPVPKDIRKAVSFKVYYPDEAKMPKGYVLDKSSFRKAEGSVVLFSISYDNGRSMVVSEQPQPPQDIIEKFKTSAIPVSNKVSTYLGQAAIGAYNNGDKIQTVTSLPITNGPWLIITAPSDVNQDELKQVLQALKK
jgi:hypothetical protein